MAESFSTRVRGVESVQARLAPITGWQSAPMLPLTQATEGLPVKDLPIHVEVALEVGEDHKDDHPDDPRTEHQLGAVHLYTQGWAVVADSLYAVLNETLSAEDRTLLTVWFSFIKLLMTALAAEPRYVGTVWRGVAADIGGEYKKGKKVRWWRFSSCTEDGDVLSIAAAPWPPARELDYLARGDRQPRWPAHRRRRRPARPPECMASAARGRRLRSIDT